MCIGQSVAVTLTNLRRLHVYIYTVYKYTCRVQHKLHINFSVYVCKCMLPSTPPFPFSLPLMYINTLNLQQDIVCYKIHLSEGALQRKRVLKKRKRKT